jgi:selenocysteine lyase/cysteine desulfurase
VDAGAETVTAAYSLASSFDESESFFAHLRATEYARLDADNQAYLDFTGSALYAERQIASHAGRLRRTILGNPHSENGPSLISTAIINETKKRVLSFLDADESEYVVIFTANTSAAIKLVAESFQFGARTPLVLTTDNHNSMNGVREFAGSKGAPVEYIGLDRNMRLDRPKSALRGAARLGRGLFGFPVQSNFSGVKHPLGLIDAAQGMGFVVLLDAAAFLPTNRLSLREHQADFVALSMYKITGYPTGVGALVAHRDAIAQLRRLWFAGGTVEYASVQHQTQLLRDHNGEGYEDGTPAFLSISAVNDGLDLLDEIGMDRINERVTSLMCGFTRDLVRLKRRDGGRLVKIYGGEGIDRGATVAFNLLSSDDRVIPFGHVVDRARNEGVSLRGGCFCNPGASEAAFDFPLEGSKRCFRAASSKRFTIEALSECLGPDVAVGAVRASIGIPTNHRDLDRTVSVISTFG